MSAEILDVLVVGGGVAGLSAAVAAAEEGPGARVVLVDKAPAEETGGNTRWTDGYFRLADVYEPAEGFAEDVAAFSDGRTDPTYVDQLLRLLPETMEWVQGHGVRFQRRATYFVTASKPRMMPVGGGEALVRSLTSAAESLGVTIRYGTPLTGLRPHAEGFEVTLGDGERVVARNCVIASGGFEGSSRMLAEHLGPEAERMKPIAPGGSWNTGDAINLALGVGAAASGDWANFHGEPVDARSSQPEASVMVFPYGVLVDIHARRFVDEGRGTVDETYEELARDILALPRSTAFFVSDSRMDTIPGIGRGLLTDRSPVRAETLQDLAGELGLDDPGALVQTVAEFNDSVQEGTYDPLRPDGLSTEGLTPPKSNWAAPIDAPPYYGIPLTTDIVFTFGGLSTDEFARVLSTDGRPIPGLFAAGECTGIYYRKYPGATSVMRGLIFGRLAGQRAVARTTGVPGVEVGGPA